MCAVVVVVVLLYWRVHAPNHQLPGASMQLFQTGTWFDRQSTFMARPLRQHASTVRTMNEYCAIEQVDTATTTAHRRLRRTKAIHDLTHLQADSGDNLPETALRLLYCCFGTIFQCFQWFQLLTIYSHRKDGDSWPAVCVFSCRSRAETVGRLSAWLCQDLMGQKLITNSSL